MAWDRHTRVAPSLGDSSASCFQYRAMRLAGKKVSEMTCYFCVEWDVKPCSHFHFPAYTAFLTCYFYLRCWHCVWVFVEFTRKLIISLTSCTSSKTVSLDWFMVAILIGLPIQNYANISVNLDSQLYSVSISACWRRLLCQWCATWHWLYNSNSWWQFFAFCTECA